MQRTNTYKLKPTKEQRKILLEMCVLSGAVFNIANYEFRQAVFRKEKVKRFFNVQNNSRAHQSTSALAGVTPCRCCRSTANSSATSSRQ